MLKAVLRSSTVTEKITDFSPGPHSRQKRDEITAKVTDLVSPSPRHPLNLENSIGSFRSFSTHSTSNSTDANRINELGRELFKKGDRNGALEQFETSLKILEDRGQNTQAFAVACCGKASCYEEQNIQNAIQWFLKALSIYEGRSIGNPAELCLKIGSLYESIGESTSALTYFLKAEITPELHMKIALLYDEQNDAIKALEHLQLSLNGKEATAEIYDFMGALYDELGNTEKALTCYSESFVLQDPSRFEHLLTMRPVLKVVYGTYKTEQTSCSAASIGRARLLFQGVNKAFSRFVRAVHAKADLFPDDHRIPLLWKSLGDLYKSQGKEEEAQTCFNKANLFPKEKVRDISTTMSPKRTLISREMESLIDELKSYKSSRKDKMDAANSLGSLLTEYTNGRIEAREVEVYLLNAFKLNPNPIFEATLGSILEKHFRRALNLIPNRG